MLHKATKDTKYLAGIKKTLLLLAQEHEAADDEIVIAATVQAHTYNADFVYNLWHQEVSNHEELSQNSECPTTLSGRTFQFNSPLWWEPKRRERPMTYYVGGQQKLLNSFPLYLPSKLWVEVLGWIPSHDNPLIWYKNDTPIARYEQLHGELISPAVGYFRQPKLSRWIVKKSAWSEALKLLKNMK